MFRRGRYRRSSDHVPRSPPEVGGRRTLDSFVADPYACAIERVGSRKHGAGSGKPHRFGLGGVEPSLLAASSTCSATHRRRPFRHPTGEDRNETSSRSLRLRIVVRRRDSRRGRGRKGAGSNAGSVIDYVHDCFRRTDHQFLCWTDVKPVWTPCSNPVVYPEGTFKNGLHTFRAKSVTPNGDSEPGSYTWNVQSAADGSRPGLRRRPRARSSPTRSDMRSLPPGLPASPRRWEHRAKASVRAS